MAELSKALLDMLTEFMICEIGSKALDGITYTMLFKNDKDKDAYNRYMTIKKEATKCGYTNSELFRVYEINNGYIFDMDIKTTKLITAQIAKAVAAANNGATPVGDIIGDSPEVRRKKDMYNMAKYLKSEYDKGNTEVEVALFSRNSTNRIIVTGKGPHGETLAIRYNAYVLRHWDIEYLNEHLLIPIGFRVSRIQPCEVLPSKTGVSFIFRLESMDEYNL